MTLTVEARSQTRDTRPSPWGRWIVVATIIGATLAPAAYATSPSRHLTVEDAYGARRCRPDPFNDSVSRDLAARYPGRSITAALHDTRTGCTYTLNQENRQKTASVFKLLVLAGTLLEAQDDSRDLSPREIGLLRPMITKSTNAAPRILWRSFGGEDWFRQTANRLELDSLDIVGDYNTSPWGRTSSSAVDQMNLVGKLLLEDQGIFEERYRAMAVELLTSVIPEQSWGISAGVPADWTVALKNGFDGSIVNSVGWVDEPGSSDGYVIAILTNGSGTAASGIAVVESISEIAARAMLLPAPGPVPQGVE